MVLANRRCGHRRRRSTELASSRCRLQPRHYPREASGGDRAGRPGYAQALLDAQHGDDQAGVTDAVKGLARSAVFLRQRARREGCCRCRLSSAGCRIARGRAGASATTTRMAAAASRASCHAPRRRLVRDVERPRQRGEVPVAPRRRSRGMWRVPRRPRRRPGSLDDRRLRSASPTRPGRSGSSAYELERRASEIAAWTTTLPAGSRYGIVQAFRQCLEAAVRWNLMRSNPARLAGPNPQPKRDEVVPFEPSEVEAIAAELGSVYGPLVIVAAYTGLRPSEWIALEWKDVDRSEGVLRGRACLLVRRSPRRRRRPRAAVGAFPSPLLGPRKRSRCSHDALTRGSSSPAHEGLTSTCGTGESASGGPRSRRPDCGHRRRRASRSRCRVHGRTTYDTATQRGAWRPVSPPTTWPATWVRACG